MFTVTLICNPNRTDLDITLIENLRNAWGGGDAIWLNTGEAAEFPLPYLPENQWTVWQDLQGIGVDLVIQPTKGRKKQMLLADMDSTMIQQECIDELAAEAGVGNHVADITARAMNGELDFDTALRERVGLLAGLDVNVIDHVLATRITLMPGGPALLATMKANGANAALVSGGFTDFTSHIAQTLGFDQDRANTLIQKNGKLTGEVGTPILGRDAKVQTLNEITQAHNLTPADVIAVGDGANDLGMLQAAGTGVALHAKPVVQDQVQVRINHGDLTALLYIQGYSMADFVT
ncbi:MAG: phosphoserine phosphatase SerB [Planktomarina sp.]